MCAWVAMVGAGVFAQSGGIASSTTTNSISSKLRQGISTQFEKYKWDNMRGQSETIRSAITANDYSLLSTSEQSKITTDQFAQMVSMNAARTAHQSALESAVKNNNFVAYQTEQTSFKATMDNLRMSDAREWEDTDDETHARRQDSKASPSIQQQKARFNKLVEYYKTNGSLPQAAGKWRFWHSRATDHDGRRSGKMMMSKTIQAALEANDYSLLSAEEQTKITSNQFAQMLSMKSTMESGRLALESAIKANDFVAFKTARATQQSVIQANKSVDSDNVRPTPTDTQLQAQFDKAVVYYKVNASLPEGKMMDKKINWQDHGKMNKDNRQDSTTPDTGLVSITSK